MENAINTNEWSSKPDENGVITIPDHLDKLFNKLGMQLRFHTMSGKNEAQTVADMVKIADDFFKTPNPKGKL